MTDRPRGRRSRLPTRHSHKAQRISALQQQARGADGPRQRDFRALRAAGGATTTCGRRRAASPCPRWVRGQWRASTRRAVMPLHSSRTTRWGRTPDRTMNSVGRTRNHHKILIPNGISQQSFGLARSMANARLSTGQAEPANGHSWAVIRKLEWLVAIGTWSARRTCRSCSLPPSASRTGHSGDRLSRGCRGGSPPRPGDRSSTPFPRPR